MEKKFGILSISFAIMLISAGLVMITGDDAITLDAKGDDLPTRGLLGTSENYNVSFSNVNFYGTDDPYYPDDVEENDWDDIGLVVFLQDKHMGTKTVTSGSNSYDINTAEIYQAVYVPVNGTTISTGTKQRVLMEDVTAVWCPPCAGIIGAMDRMNHDDDWFPDKYIGIEYHASSNSDVYYRAASATRMNFYAAPAYPTYTIDGVDPSVGGSTDANNTAIDSNLKTRINARATAAPISIEAFGGHDSSNTWVNFTITVEDVSFDNALVTCNVMLVQDAHPRRHNRPTGAAEARLGLILEKASNFRVFDIDGAVPEINVGSPSPDDVLSGTETISWSVTDADASDSHIRVSTEIRPVGGNWATLEGNGPAVGSFPLNTLKKTDGTNYDYPDGDYEIRISAIDYWEDENEHIIPVSILNPDSPTFEFNDQAMAAAIDEEPVIGELEILWFAEDDEDGSDLTIDLYYKRVGDPDWTVIEEDLENIGTYLWDTSDPRIPDNDKYMVHGVATDGDEMTASAESIGFSIDNPDPPVAEFLRPTEGEEFSGEATIRWRVNDIDPRDSYTDMKVTLSLSSDGGENYDEPLLTQSYNPASQTYTLDTMSYDDGYDYKLKLTAEDTFGLTHTVESPVFTIYNNDPPEATIREPSTDDTVAGTVEIQWSAHDEEDASEVLEVLLEYRLAGDSWESLLDWEANPGSFSWDTTLLEDGYYNLRLLMRDSREEVSTESLIGFNVYNPDPPVISNPQKPSGEIFGYALFSWIASDPDPNENENLLVWIYIAPQDGEYTLVEGGIPNIGSYNMDMTGLEDGTYRVKLEVYDLTEGNLSAVHTFEDLVVNNPDAPTVGFLSAPTQGDNRTGEITLSWEGEDLDGDDLTYKLYYSKDGGDWELIVTTTETTYTWNTSDLQMGNYKVKVVVIEGTNKVLEDSDESGEFLLWVEPQEQQPTDDDDDDTSSDKSGDGISPILVGAIGLIVLLAVVMGLMAVLVIKKMRDESANPPGGLPPGGLPGQAQGGLPPGAPPSGYPGLQQRSPSQLPPPRTDIPQQTQVSTGQIQTSENTLEYQRPLQ